MTAIAFAIVFAWSLFGKSEKTETPAPEPAPTSTAAVATASAPVPAVDTEKIVQAAVDKAVKETAARIAKEAADAQVEKIKAETKAAADERAAAEKRRAEEKAADDKRRAEEKVAEDKRRAEEKENAKVEKAERAESLKQIDSRIFKLHHASASEIATNLNEMWNGEFGNTWKTKKMAIAFTEQNSVLVTAPRLILEACERIIRELDVEPRQVYIEARFVELANNASHKLGIDWSMLDGMKGTLALSAGYDERKVEGISTYNSSTGEFTIDTSSSSPGQSEANLSHASATIGMSDLYVVLRALETSQDARTFSNPKIIVSSGKKATVDMTEKYPNVTISAKRTTSGSSDSMDLSMKLDQIPGEDKFMFAKEAFFSWGIELEVTPRIGTNGLINVQIVPTISSQADWVTAGATDTSTEDSNVGTYSSKYPVIDVQRLVTEFNMESGTTAVIGGLSRTVEKQVDSGIPWLRDWWWIGPRLFGSKVRVKEQKEIIVFVTVGLVDPRNIAKDAGLPKNAVLGRQYTQDLRREPGDRRRTRPEGMQSLDLRSLEEQYADPRRTNRAARITWDEYKPFTKDPNYQYDKEEKK